MIVTLSFILGYLLMSPLIDELFGPEKGYVHTYTVDISTNTTEVYVVMVPIPMNISGGSPEGLLSNIAIEAGGPSLSIVETEHGLALRIASIGDSRIRWEMVTPDLDCRYGNLTMTTGADGWSSEGPAMSWFYFDHADLRLEFFYESIHHYMVAPHFASGGGPIYSFRGQPPGIGWQQLMIDYGWMLIN